MPSVNNITKTIESTSVHTESTNATIVKNTVETQVNGVSPTTQNYSSSSLNVSDYAGLSQAQQQSGYFISKTDNPTIGSQISDYTSYQQDSALMNVGSPYNYASDVIADDKEERVITDYKEKEDYALDFSEDEPLDFYSESIVTAQIETIQKEYGSSSRTKSTIRRIYPDTSSWKLYGGELMKGKGRTNMDWCVTIMEDRDSIEKIASEGEFSTDLVKVLVYQRVGNFSFGTAQSFQSVSPRGSQTPMRFYENNGGRVLSFSAEFHQQEFPLEPLLSIAEKLQYLARPYRHGDYSLIPKLVRITIPGRTFRGYLTNVDITYQGEDYTSWNSEEIKSALQASDWGDTYSVFGGYEYKNGNNYRPNLNSNDAITYGMERMSASLQLAIVEEIKLAQYTTFSEKQQQYIQDNQERASIIREDVEKQWEDRIIEVQQYTARPEFDYAYDDKGNLIRDVPPEQLIYVDIATGEFRDFAFDADGNYQDPYDPSTMITLEEFKKREEIKNENKETELSDVYKEPSNVYNELEKTQTHDELVAQIIFLQKQAGLVSPPAPSKETLEGMTDTELMQLRQNYMKQITPELTEEINFFGSYFAVITTNKQTLAKETEYVLPNGLKELLSVKIEKFEDVVRYLKIINTVESTSPKGTLHFESEGVNLESSQNHKLAYKIVSMNNLYPTIISNRYDKTISQNTPFYFNFEVIPVEEKYKTMLQEKGYIKFPWYLIVQDPDSAKKILTVFDQNGKAVDDFLVTYVVSFFSSFVSKQVQTIKKLIEDLPLPFKPDPATAKGDGVSDFFYLVLRDFEGIPQ